MDFQVKLFTWRDQGNHLIILTRGAMNCGAFRVLFAKIEATTQNLNECKVLVDLSDSSCQIDDAEIQELATRLPLNRWPKENRIALVAGPETADCDRLFCLRTELEARGLAIGVFRNFIAAIDWLAGMT
jgi:hypothetical protein